MIAMGTTGGNALRCRASVVASVLAAMVAITSCSSSNHEAAASPPPSRAVTTYPAATPTTRSSGSPTNSTAIRAIKTSYLRFFSPAASLNEAVALLQNGPAFTDTLKAQARTPFAKTTTVTVSKVTLDSPNKATVVYSILLSGTPVLVDTTGAAVRDGGRWKVAGATFCGLLSAQGAQPPACARVTAMSAPN